MATSSRDYYQVLGVQRDASEEAIKKAFRRLAMQYHPDRNNEKGSEGKFKEINEAYQVLSDPEKRAKYDRFGHAGLGGQHVGQGFEGSDPFAGFGDIFDAFFGGFGTQTRATPRQGEDISYEVSLTFEEAVLGAEREVEIPRTELCSRCRGKGGEPGTQASTCSNCRGTGQVRRVQQSLFGQFVQVVTCQNCRGQGHVITTPCTNCRGSGRERRVRRLAVRIPAGVDNESVVRLTGEGNVGTEGGPPGSLYISVNVQPHPFFRRHGYDLLYELPLNFAQAALGDEVQVPTLNGKEDLKIPSGVQSGAEFRIKGKGVPSLEGRGRGDLRVIVKVVTPSKLSPEQKKLLQELSQTFGDRQNKDGKRV